MIITRMSVLGLALVGRANAGMQVDFDSRGKTSDQGLFLGALGVYPNSS